MGSSKHFDSHQRCSIYQEDVWALDCYNPDRIVATGPVYPLRTSSISRSIPDLPSYGSGLEHSNSRYMR